MEGLKTYGFFLNGEKLLNTTRCFNAEQAKKKLNFKYPVNFNIELKEIKNG